MFKLWNNKYVPKLCGDHIRRQGNTLTRNNTHIWWYGLGIKAKEETQSHRKTHFPKDCRNVSASLRPTSSTSVLHVCFCPIGLCLPQEWVRNKLPTSFSHSFVRTHCVLSRGNSFGVNMLKPEFLQAQWFVPCNTSRRINAGVKCLAHHYDDCPSVCHFLLTSLEKIILKLPSCVINYLCVIEKMVFKSWINDFCCY